MGIEYENEGIECEVVKHEGKGAELDEFVQIGEEVLEVLDGDEFMGKVSEGVIEVLGILREGEPIKEEVDIGKFHDGYSFVQGQVMGFMNFGGDVDVSSLEGYWDLLMKRARMVGKNLRELILVCEGGGGNVLSHSMLKGMEGRFFWTLWDVVWTHVQKEYQEILLGETEGVEVPEEFEDVSEVAFCFLENSMKAFGVYLRWCEVLGEVKNKMSDLDIDVGRLPSCSGVDFRFLPKGVDMEKLSEFFSYLENEGIYSKDVIRDVRRYVFRTCVNELIYGEGKDFGTKMEVEYLNVDQLEYVSGVMRMGDEKSFLDVLLVSLLVEGRGVNLGGGSDFMREVVRRLAEKARGSDEGGKGWENFCDLVKKYPSFELGEDQKSEENLMGLSELHFRLLGLVEGLVGEGDEDYRKFLFRAVRNLDIGYGFLFDPLFLRKCEERNGFVVEIIRDRICKRVFDEGDLDAFERILGWEKEGLLRDGFEDVYEDLMRSLSLVEVEGAMDFFRELGEFGGFVLDRSKAFFAMELFENRDEIQPVVKELSGYIRKYRYGPRLEENEDGEGKLIWSPKELLVERLGEIFGSLHRYLYWPLTELLNEENDDFEDWFLEVLFLEARKVPGYEGRHSEEECLESFKRVFRRYWGMLNEIDGLRILGGKRTWNLMTMVECIAKKPNTVDWFFDFMGAGQNLFGWAMRDGAAFSRARRPIVKEVISGDVYGSVKGLERVLTKVNEVRDQVFGVLGHLMQSEIERSKSRALVEVDGEDVEFGGLSKEQKIEKLKEIYDEVRELSRKFKMEQSAEVVVDTGETIEFGEGLRFHLAPVDSVTSVLENGNLPGELLRSGVTDAYPFHVDLIVLQEKVDDLRDALTLPLEHLPNYIDPDQKMNPSYYGRRGKMGKEGQIAVLYGESFDEWDDGKRFFVKHDGKEFGVHELVLGGIPSGEIKGIVALSSKVRRQLIRAIVNAGVYVPIYDSRGKLIFGFSDFGGMRSELGEVHEIEEWEGVWMAGKDDVEAGSMWGGICYEPGEDGLKKYYVKFGKLHDFGQVAREVMADRFYERAGVKVANSDLVKIGGIVGRRTEWIDHEPLSEDLVFEISNLADQIGMENLKQSVMRLAEKSGGMWAEKNWRAGAVMDWWLANWDIANDRNVRVSGGAVVRLDNGGALDYRASGKAKEEFGVEVKEAFENVGSEKPFSEGMRQLYKGLIDEEVVEQVKNLKRIFSDEVIAEIVEGVSGMMKEERDKLKVVLGKRRDWLYEKFCESEGG